MKNLFDLQGRTALVTGASSGLGNAMADALASAGATVILVARSRSALDKAATDLVNRHQTTCHCLSADLSDRNQLRALAGKAIDTFGCVDILINAAGVNLRQPIAEIDYDSWDLQINLHLTAPFFLAQSLAPHMAAKGWGRIINLASLQSVRAFANSAPYGAGKGGIVQLTRAMAEAWSAHGINVNAIAPGFFPTPLTAAVFDNPDLAAKNAQQTMIGRNGILEDMHGPTLFLASQASQYVTGQTLFVDGGFSAK